MLFALLLVTFIVGVICGGASARLLLGYLHPRAGSCETKIVSEPIVSVTVVSASSFRALGWRSHCCQLQLSWRH